MWTLMSVIWDISCHSQFAHLMLRAIIAHVLIYIHQNTRLIAAVTLTLIGIFLNV